MGIVLKIKNGLSLFEIAEITGDNYINLYKKFAEGDLSDMLNKTFKWLIFSIKLYQFVCSIFKIKPLSRLFIYCLSILRLRNFFLTINDDYSGCSGCLNLSLCFRCIILSSFWYFLTNRMHYLTFYLFFPIKNGQIFLNPAIFYIVFYSKILWPFGFRVILFMRNDRNFFSFQEEVSPKMNISH